MYAHRRPTPKTIAHEIEAAGLWPEAAAGALALAAVLVPDAAAGTSRPEQDVLRRVADRLVQPGHSATVPLLRTAPADSTDGAKDEAAPLTLDDIAGLGERLHDPDKPQDTAVPHALDMLTAVLALPAPDSTAPAPSMLAVLLAEHSTARQDPEDLALALLRIAAASLFALGLRGGPPPADTIAALRVGLAQAADELGPPSA